MGLYISRMMKIAEKTAIASSASVTTTVGLGGWAKRPKPTDVMANHQTRNTRSVSGRPFCSILRNSSQDHAEAVVTRMEHFAPNDRQTTINARVVSMAISLRQTGLRSARRDASLGQMRLRPATPIDDTRCGSP